MDNEKAFDLITLQRGIAYEVLSLKLLTGTLKEIMKLLDWDGFSININANYIHFKFADHKSIISTSRSEMNKTKTVVGFVFVIVASTKLKVVIKVSITFT